MGNTTKTPEELKKEEEKKADAEAKKAEADAKKADAAAKKAEEEAKKAEEEANLKAEEAKKAEEEAEAKRLADAEKLKNEVSLYNVLGKKVKTEDYFFKNIIPAGFAGTCGKPVDREDLISVFHKVFKPEDNILFYKQVDKEVYIVIIPLKYATEVGDSEDSLEGDFQKHAISFINEGSVNLDTMRQKLEKINKFVKYSDR